MTLFFVLPAYNESENILPLLEKINSLEFNKKIILVDDGSTDDTIFKLENFKNKTDILVEKHSENLGLGEALKTGLRKVLTFLKDEDLVVIMDADNSHPPTLVPEMMEKIDEGADVVIASRYVADGKEIGLSFTRRFLSYFCSVLLKMFFPIRNVKDYSCGYRMIKGKILKELAQKTGNNFYEEKGFVCMSEMLINFSECKARFDETPLVLRYDLKKGRSKMKVFPTVLRYIVLILKKI